MSLPQQWVGLQFLIVRFPDHTHLLLNKLFRIPVSHFDFDGIFDALVTWHLTTQLRDVHYNQCFHSIRFYPYQGQKAHKVKLCVRKIV